MTMFGLFIMKIFFDDRADDMFAINQVNKQLVIVSLPDEVGCEVQPPYRLAGEIFRYALQSLQSKNKGYRKLLVFSK